MKKIIILLLFSITLSAQDTVQFYGMKNGKWDFLTLSSNENNLYKIDGALTDNRTVDQNGNELNIIGGEFNQERQDLNSTFRIENKNALSGLGADGIGMSQQANGYFTSIFTGDASLVGGEPNQGSLIVINDDFATVGAQVVNQIRVSENETFLLSLQAGLHQSGITANSQGLILDVNGPSPPETGVKITRLAGSSGILGHTADGYIKSVPGNLVFFDKQTVNLSANTPTTITFSLTEYYTILVEDANGNTITPSIKRLSDNSAEITVSVTDDYTIRVTGI